MDAERSKSLTFRVTEVEKAMIESAAALDGRPVAQWLRKVAMAEANKGAEGETPTGTT